MSAMAARDDADDAPQGDGEKTFAFLMALRAQGVRDLAVLRAMERVPRHAFAPARYADLARTDVSIPLPCGQTMTPPTLVARLLVSLEVKPGQRIMEVGTGSAYVAALMADMGAQIVSVERFRTLAIAAYERLGALGIRGVELQHGDGLNGSRLLGRFDRIILNGVVDAPPESLVQRLEIGGRLVGAIRVDGLPRKVVLTRIGESAIDHHLGGAVRLSPLAAGVSETL
jgi:protein-L-isoaspartate(D-aspartate) O-methyltransferase